MTFYQSLDFFQRFPAHTFCNRVFIHVKVLATLERDWSLWIT
jgi:hypothetical protein